MIEFSLDAYKIELNRMLHAPFQDNQIKRITGYQNNCGLNVLAHQFTNDLALGLQDQFKDERYYKKLLKHFRAYHFQPELSWPALKEILLKNLNHPITLEVLMGPVLRKTLGDVLKANEDNKAIRLSDFQTFVRAALQDRGNIEHTYFAMSEACNPKVATVAQEFKEFNKRADVIALENPEARLDQFMAEKEHEIDVYWDTTGYNAYVDFLCDPYNEIPLAPEDVEQLSRALHYNIELYQGADKTKWEGGHPLPAPVATIKMYNRAGDHYEAIVEDEAIAAIHNAQFEQQVDDFQKFKVGKMEYVGKAQTLNRSEISTWQADETQDGLLFNRANDIMSRALDVGVSNKQFTLLWDNLERCVKEGNTKKIEEIEKTVNEIAKPRSKL
ncbi:MAG: hypothetical protein U1E78_06750 [Gammaproteobacteria bacterium]